MRAYEQIRDIIGIQNLNVKIIGVGGGLAYGKAGPTHFSLEDISLMRNIPNMTIISPSDPYDAYSATKKLITHKGPSYMRFERNPLKPIYDKNHKFVIGRGVKLKEGGKVAIIATGKHLETALIASDILRKKKISTSVYSFPTIRPLDKSLILKIAKKHSLIATIEEHFVSGGFATEVLENVSVFNNKQIIRFGLKNSYPTISESYEKLIERNGLTPEAIVKKILRVKV